MTIAVEQDGLRTDERLVVGWLERLEPPRPTSRIVLLTMVVAAGGLLLAIGTLLALFMERPAGFVFAGSCRALAGLLMGALRFLCGRSQSRDREALQPSPSVRRWVRAVSDPLTSCEHDRETRISRRAGRSAPCLPQPSFPDRARIIQASCRCRIVRRAAASPRVPPWRRCKQTDPRGLADDRHHRRAAAGAASAQAA
jgi:hypothetical protein